MADIIKILDRPKYNWIKDKSDNRDIPYQYIVTPIPTQVDLRKYCTSIEDQSTLGSCTAQAIAGAIEMLYNRSGKLLDVSRLFIYYYERAIEGTTEYDNGAYTRTGLKVCAMLGVPKESLWPYIIDNFTKQPSASSIIDASRRRVTLYKRLPNHKACLDALASGYPVIAGYDVYDSFDTNTVAANGMMPYPNKQTERLLGGHAVLLVGYDMLKRLYIVRNSFGTDWGDNGYFYMPFEVIEDKTMSDDFWIIKSVNNL